MPMPQLSDQPQAKLKERRSGAGRSRNVPVLLTVLLTVLGLPVAFAADTPITPNASPEVHSLPSHFLDIYGTRILSGQQTDFRGTNGNSFELTHITNTTEELPALLALDFIFHTEQASHLRCRPGKLGANQHLTVPGLALPHSLTQNPAVIGFRPIQSLVYLHPDET